jgi:hypothetical protein
MGRWPPWPFLTSRTAAEAFAAGDPFVLNPTANWRLREWTDIVVSQLAWTK